VTVDFLSELMRGNGKLRCYQAAAGWCNMQDLSPGISFQVSVQHKQVANLHTCGSRCLLIAERKLCSQKEVLDFTL
jgi:hypothetical protein